MKIKNKYWETIAGGDGKLPRKIKKWYYGKRYSRNQLSRLLATVEIVSGCGTMYERTVIKPYSFCPNCGCKHYYGTGNMTSYPEHWEEFHCVRCNFIVGYIDNSPFIHALECRDENYNCVF